MNLSITCDKCESPVSHVCNPEIKTTLLKLHTFKPEFPPHGALLAALKESPYYEEGDEDTPFFSEAFLYCLLGKEDARTLRAYLNSVHEAIGLARHGFYPELVKLERARELVDATKKRHWELADKVRKAKDPEEKKALKKEFEEFIQERDANEELDRAHRLLRLLERWEKPEERTRKDFLGVISVIASDDQFMTSLKGLDTTALEARLRAFLKAQVEE